MLRTCCLFVCLLCVSTSKIDCSLQCLRTCKAKLLHVVLSHRQHCCLSCFRIDSIVAGCALARTKHWLDAKRLRAKQIVCDKAVRLCLCIASFRRANANFALAHKDFVGSNWCFRIQCYCANALFRVANCICLRTGLAPGLLCGVLLLQV